MGLWERFAGMFRSKSIPWDPIGPLTINDAISYPLYNQPPKRGTRELIVAWKKMPFLRAATARIASHVSQVTWRVYVRSARQSTAKYWEHGKDKPVFDSIMQYGSIEQRAARRKTLVTEGRLREITDHPLLDFLNHPNFRHTGRAATQMVQTYLDLKGEAFLAIERNGEGMPIGYYPFPPHWVIDVPNRALPDSFRISYGTIQGLVPQTEMIWLRELDPENPYGRGTGVGEALGDELETDEYAAKMLKAWFYNTAMPDFIASFEGANEGNLKAAKERWDQEHRAGSNRGRSYFTGAKMSVTRLDTSFKDQQILELRKTERDFITQTFGIPPEVMGIIENSNRATIQAAFYLFATNVLMPRLEFWRTELQHRLVPEFDDRLILDFESPVPEDKEFSLKVATALPGAFSLNEWRAFAGHEPIPEFAGMFPPLTLPGQAPQSAADQVAPPEEDGDGGKPNPSEPEPADEVGDLEHDSGDDFEDGKALPPGLSQARVIALAASNEKV